jgi:acyl-CoA synthetase (AMP-forming)/AMP-acid ligase II
LWAGGVLVPVNIRWSVPEIAESLAEVDARLLAVDDAFAGCVDSINAAHGDPAHVVHSGDGPTPDGMLAFEQLVATRDPVEDAHRGGDQLAGVFYTGGTTGRSKGVMLSHDNLMTSSMGWLATDDYYYRRNCFRPSWKTTSDVNLMAGTGSRRRCRATASCAAASSRRLIAFMDIHPARGATAHRRTASTASLTQMKERSA